MVIVTNEIRLSSLAFPVCGAGFGPEIATESCCAQTLRAGNDGDEAALSAVLRAEAQGMEAV